MSLCLTLQYLLKEKSTFLKPTEKEKGIGSHSIGQVIFMFYKKFLSK